MIHPALSLLAHPGREYLCYRNSAFTITSTSTRSTIYRQGKQRQTTSSEHDITSTFRTPALGLRPRSLIHIILPCIYNLHFTALPLLYTDEGRDLRILSEEDLPVSHPSVACKAFYGLQIYRKPNQQPKHQHVSAKSFCTRTLGDTQSSRDIRQRDYPEDCEEAEAELVWVYGGRHDLVTST